MISAGQGRYCNRPKAVIYCQLEYLCQVLINMARDEHITDYDSVAETYISHVERELSYNNLYERPYMLSIFDDFDGENVLDVGCGSGFYSEYALNKNANVTGVDASQKMLDYIRGKNNSANLKLIRADIGQGLPYIETASQDYIICSLVLQYIENWKGIISEFYRVLKKDGKVYISTHHPFADFLHLKKESYFDKYLVEDVWGQKRRPFRVHYYTRSLTDVLRPILSSGFVIKLINEPQPTLKCEKLAPETYKELKKRPAFLFFILEK
jgi:ubiquinone/menaquinone biosynthesis C-methylase UbiE